MSITGIASLAKSLAGEVVLPDDRRYAKLRRVSNHAVNKHPAVIVRCATRQDVQLAVDFSHSKGLLTAVRSGGHSFAGHGVCDDGLVIDLSPMTRVEIDPAHETIRIEPGIVAGELDTLTQAFRMAVPLGSCPTVRRGRIFTRRRREFTYPEVRLRMR
jgi:FAD/FMN-containing dehydrogenase